MPRCRWWRSPCPAVYDKVLSNAQEAKARDAQLIGVVPLNDEEAEFTFDSLLPVPVGG
jgi:glucosamine--fructose-6-phosphate aminotransferase (isomerizing)